MRIRLSELRVRSYSAMYEVLTAPRPDPYLSRGTRRQE